MIPKIIWSHVLGSDRGNPFGGVDGFRPIRLTFHTSSLGTIAGDEKKALELLNGLAELEDVDALSFDGSVGNKIFIESEKEGEHYIGLQIINSEGKSIRHSLGVSTSWLGPSYLVHLLGGTYISSEEEKNRSARQEVLEAKAHESLRRDIFITSSNFLLKNRDELEGVNVRTPTEALKIVGLYLRMKGEFEWISHVQGKARWTTSREWFYKSLSRGLLPNSWRYTSSLGLHPQREMLISLAWGVLNRYARALQARDEIGRLFYMPQTSSSQDQIAYHFDYLTVLLTAALDAQASIINEVYGLSLDKIGCGVQRKSFQKAVKKNPATSNLDALLIKNQDLIEILFELRNKIHSTSLQIDFHVPVTSPDALVHKINTYASTHWGIREQKVQLSVNNSPFVPSIHYSIDLYNLAHALVNETTKLINLLMEETKVEDYLDAGDLHKIDADPPDSMVEFIQTYLRLA